MTAHTPGPWEAATGGPGTKSAVRIVVQAYSPYDRIAVLETWSDGIGNDSIAKANADFIVRAANSHADLLEALEAVLADYASPTVHYADWVPSVERARAALAKGKG